MNTLLTGILLLLFLLPFVTLVTDALGRTQDRLVPVALAVTVISYFLTLMAGGLHQRPHVANLFAIALLVWPTLLLAAKGYNPGLSWVPLGLSIPIMSWYLVNISIQFYYPYSGSPLSGSINLLFGWISMFVPFIPQLGLLLAGRAILRSLRARRRRLRKPAKSPAP